MKLSMMQTAYNLAVERRNAALSLEDLNDGAECEVAFNGWPVEISDDDAEILRNAAVNQMEEDIKRIERELVALGVEIDIPIDGYTSPGFGPSRPGGHVYEGPDDDDGDDTSITSGQHSEAA